MKICMQGKPSCATTKSALLLSEDDWNTKEDTMKNALYVLQYAKMHILGWTNVEQEIIKLVVLAVIELCLAQRRMDTF